MSALMSAPQAPEALAVRDLSKTFGAVRVLHDMSLSVAPGRVHALLGQNGCGKSTLIKCLAGVHRPDAGAQVSVAGRELPASYSPSSASGLGLAFVHQDLGLVEDMTVAENLALGAGFERRGPFVAWRAQHSRARQQLEEFGLQLDPRTVVRDLPLTARSLLAIVRAFSSGRDAAAPACLVLDEPTAALPDNDADLLFAAIAEVTARGTGVVYVTHRLEEVLRICDDVTVMRDGRSVFTGTTEEMTTGRLFSLIVGPGRDPVGAAATSEATARRTAGTAVLEARGVSGAAVRDVDLTLRSGEIVGLAGLAGSGRSELARLLTGAQPVSAGTVSVHGTPVALDSPRAAIRAGIALVPENRRRDGCVLTASVRENLTLAQLPTTTFGALDVRTERRRVRQAITEFDIRPALPERSLQTLSGGNQQKVVLAKWLARRPAVLVLDEPVQGVDVGAKADIFATLRSVAAQGTAVLLVDSDFDNLVAMCDRVAVIRAGRVAEELHGDQIKAERLTQATFGVDDTDLVMPGAKEM